MRRRLLLIVGLVVMAGALAATAAATLSPQAYELLRARAPLAFDGVVLRDFGGRMDVRVEQVLRGAMHPGTVVAVAYPEDRGGAPPPGPAVYYRRFLQGDRLRIWGSGAPVIQIVHGGIDLLHRPPAAPAKSGGCGACATHPRDANPWPGLFMAASLLGLALLRRKSRD